MREVLARVGRKVASQIRGRVKKGYNPEEARDERGRWTGGDGGEFPKAGDVVDGLRVRDHVSNMDSIESSLDDYTVMPGVREVSISAFEDSGPPKFYSASEKTRTMNLADQISQSGEIEPLIVVVEENNQAAGPYILEGGHRFDALWLLGKKSFPAVVVVDHQEFDKIIKARRRKKDRDEDQGSDSVAPPPPVDPDDVLPEDLDLGDLDDLQGGEFVDALADVAADAAVQLLGQVGLDDDEEIVERVSERAVAAAREQAAELVSQVTDVTRDMIRDAVADGLERNIGLDAIADEVARSAAFGEDRARLIAQTEVRNANERGVLTGLRGARDAGNRVKKVWLVSQDGACDDCQDNADAGPIELDDVFPSGDSEPVAHPNCKCSLSGEIIEDDDGGDAYEALALIVKPRAFDVDGYVNIPFVMKEFNPDQPRDERGRWTGGDGVVPLTHLFSDSMGIEREDMPQIPRQVKQDFLDELRQRGVGVKSETVDARSLRPTQENYNPAQLQVVRDQWGDAKANPIVVSSDDRVLDGHHRWAVAAQRGEYLQVVRVDLPMDELLDLARDFNDRYGIEARKGLDGSGFFLKDFNPDQPRDDHGRWTSGGAGESQYSQDVLDRMREAERVLASTSSTHQIDTPERAAFRQRLADETYDEVTRGGSKNRQATIILGLPGAGKSTLINRLTGAGAVNVDNDEIKRKIPEYQGGNGANAVHEEASGIARVVRNRVIGQGYDLVWERIDSPDKILADIRSLRSAGYDVGVSFIDVPQSVAIDSAIGRFMRTGRYVSPLVIQGYGDSPRESYDLARNSGLVSRWQRYERGPSGTLEAVD